jgi:hypothetical protein
MSIFGIHLHREVFSLGRLYVGLSRASAQEAVAIAAPNARKDEDGSVYVRNVDSCIKFVIFNSNNANFNNGSASDPNRERSGWSFAANCFQQRAKRNKLNNMS